MLRRVDLNTMPSQDVASVDVSPELRHNILSKLQSAEDGLRLQDLVEDDELGLDRTEVRAVLFDLINDNAVAGTPDFRYVVVEEPEQEQLSA